MVAPSSVLDELKKAYEAQKAKQATYEKHPNSTGAKKNARTVGIPERGPK